MGCYGGWGWEFGNRENGGRLSRRLGFTREDSTLVPTSVRKRGVWMVQGDDGAFYMFVKGSGSKVRFEACPVKGANLRIGQIL